jgi:hypothetical protein
VDFSDCLLWWFDAKISVQFGVFSIQKRKMFCNGMASGQRESNYLHLIYWEIKNDTLAGFFDFVGASILIVKALAKAIHKLPI